MSNLTCNNSPVKYTLSQEQRQFYCDNGYLVIKGLIDCNTLYNCRKHFAQIVSDDGKKTCVCLIKETSLVKAGATGEFAVNKVQDIQLDSLFSTYTEHPRLLHVVSQLLGPRLMITHGMLINKPPGSRCHSPHQDLIYFPLRPADFIIAAWTAIDPTCIKNGTIYVVPKSHKCNTMYAHHKDPLRNQYHKIVEQSVPGASEETAACRVPLEVCPGDTVLFHPLLTHGSYPNCTKKCRKAIICHFASQKCDFVDGKGTAQEEIFREVEEAHKKREDAVCYIDIWKRKLKCVDACKSLNSSNL